MAHIQTPGLFINHEYTSAEIGVCTLTLEEVRQLSQKVETLIKWAATMTGIPGEPNSPGGRGEVVDYHPIK